MFHERSCGSVGRPRVPASSLQLKYATLCGISSVGVIQGGLFCDIIDSPHGTFYLDKESFTNYVDKILSFFDHLPPSVDIFYFMNVDKKWTFWTTYPCRRSL